MGELKIGDLYQSAYLVASGCEFPRVLFERGVAKFIFRDDDGTPGWYCEAYKLDHGNAGEELVMPVKRFIGAIRRLKGTMAAAKADLGNSLYGAH